MDMLEILKGIANVSEYIETSNYYYDYHLCSKSGERTKIMLDYTLSSDVKDCIIRFGVCKECGVCFYHRDFQSKNF